LDLDGTNSPASVEFGGVASFPSSSKITVVDATNAVTVKLNQGGALAVDGQQIITPAAGATGLLTAAGDTTLTFSLPSGGPPTLTQGKGSSTPTTHKITVTGTGGGNVQLVGNASYKVDSATGAVGTLEIDTAALAFDVGSGSLILAAPASGGAILLGPGDVIAGKTKISGGNAAGTWTASGNAGMIEITSDAITASEVTGTLTAGHANSAINVAAGGTLTVSGTIKVGTGPLGKVVLTSDAPTGAKASLLLKSGTVPGILATGLSGGATVAIGSTADASNFTINDGSTVTGTLTKVDGTALVAADVDIEGANANATSGVQFDYIKAGGSDVLITDDVDANPLNITVASKVAVPNS
jgi:hypothetical protein